MDQLQRRPLQAITRVHHLQWCRGLPEAFGQLQPQRLDVHSPPSFKQRQPAPGVHAATGGLIDIEMRPTDALSLDLQYFMSDLDATNYNRNFLFWTSNILQGGGSLLPGSPPFQAPDPGYVVRNNTLVEASWSGPNTPSTGVYDQISRPDAKATSNYGAFSASYAFSDAFTLSGEIGTSEGHGETPTQDVSETVLSAGTGGGYQLHGVNSAPDFNFGSADISTPFPGGVPVGFGWIFGAQAVDVEDQEDWAQIDADYALDGGAFTGLQFGARYERCSSRVMPSRS